MPSAHIASHCFRLSMLTPPPHGCDAHCTTYHTLQHALELCSSAPDTSCRGTRAVALVPLRRVHARAYVVEEEVRLLPGCHRWPLASTRHTAAGEYGAAAVRPWHL